MRFTMAILAALALTGCGTEKKQCADTGTSLSNKEYYRLIAESKKGNSSEENVIVNGGFENYDAALGKFEGWNDLKKQVSSSGDAASGARSAKIELSEKPKWGPTFVRGQTSYSVDLKPGSYLFSCVCKGKNLTDLKINLLLADGKIAKGTQVISLREKDMKDWKPFQALLKTPEDTGVKGLALEFLGERGAECEAFIDDVKLVRKTGSSNVMFNSSFEICTVPECPDRWTSESAQLLYPEKYNTSIVSNTAKTGSNSIKMSWHGPYDKNLAMYSRLMSGFCSGVDEGAQYTVSLWMKTDNPPVKMNLWMNYVNRKTFTIDSKEWKEYTFSSTWRQPWRNTVFAFILLFFEGKDGEMIDANVWVDDVMAEPGEKATSWKPALEDELYMDKMFPKPGTEVEKSVQIANRPELATEKVKSGSIATDGKLDEKVWSGKNTAECITPFKNTAVSNPTSCRIAYDDDYLYVALDAKRKTPKGPAKDSDSPFSGDWIEFFLDPNSSDCAYYQFVINSKGNIFTTQCRFDPIAFETPGSSGYTLISWKPKFDYAVSEGKNGWQAELKIPLNLFGSELREGKPFNVNFYRVISETGEANAWSKTQKGFHDMPLFGRLNGFKSEKEFASLDFSDITFLPSADGKTVVGKLSLKNKLVVNSLTAELVENNNKADPLKVYEENGIYNIAIPFSPREALNKTIRLSAKTKGESVQAFASVNISRLLVFGVNSAVFQGEKNFPCLVSVNLPEKERKQAVLKFTVAERKSGKKVIETELPIKSARDVYSVPFSKLPDGWHNLTASLQMHGKTIAEETRWTYLGERKKDNVRVCVENMRIERNGKPFFMLGTWNILKDPKVNFKQLSKYKDFGVNTITISLLNYRSKYEDFDFDLIFDEAEKAGLLVIPDFTYLMVYGEKMHKYSRDKIFDIIKSFVKKYKDRPSLLMYHGMDEWVAGRQRSLPFCSDEDLEKVYWLVRENDPYHPFFFNLGPRTWAWGDLRFTDIFSYDCYIASPAPYETNMERFDYYASEGEKCAVDNLKPMFNVIQFSCGTEIFQTRLMRYNEQRCLAYVTILNGSKGILFYTGLSWCEPKNKQLPSISEELNQLAPVLLGYEREERIETGTKDVLAKYLLFKGAFWIICANAGAKEVHGVEMDLNGILQGSHKAKAVFNGCEKSIENGKLKLDFEPYECFVYKVDVQY